MILPPYRPGRPSALGDLLSQFSSSRWLDSWSARASLLLIPAIPSFKGRLFNPRRKKKKKKKEESLGVDVLDAIA